MRIPGNRGLPRLVAPRVDQLCTHEDEDEDEITVLFVRPE
jgi:hypothetical protein